ncbi:MAG: hypothetical protein K5982_01510 [Selenomonadaceae bacterium]|nr:hypothetical protein [Selenomonadaceae bacterium]
MEELKSRRKFIQERISQIKVEIEDGEDQENIDDLKALLDELQDEEKAIQSEIKKKKREIKKVEQKNNRI